MRRRRFRNVPLPKEVFFVGFGVLAVMGLTGYQSMNFLNWLMIAILVLLLVILSVAFVMEKKWAARSKLVGMDEIDQMSGVAFENYVEKLMSGLGYKVTINGGSGDLGVDLILEKRGERIAVQAKRQANKVNRRAISDAVAGKNHYRCDVAMVVTNNHFTKDAQVLAKSNDCRLVDRKTLEKLIVEWKTGI